MNIMKNKLHWAIAAIMLFGFGLLSGCYPNDDLTNSESDIVKTNYSDTVNFSRINTYYLPDTILPVKDKDDTTTVKENMYTELILSEIEKNMTDYGYTRITELDSANPPDVLMLASSVVTVNYAAGYIPGWGWGGYPGWGWGYPGWGYYPPYYSPGYVYSYSYTMGSVLIDMLDPYHPYVVEGDTVLPVYWDAAFTGLLQGSLIEDRIKTNIDQAFKMSPYLKEGK